MSTSCSHLEKMLVIFLLSNIDPVTMVMAFGELNIIYAISWLLYEISSKSLHELKVFRGRQSNGVI